MEYDIEKLRMTVEGALKKASKQYKTTTNSRGTVYSLESKDAVLEITLGTEWLGYELIIKKTVLGKELSMFVDTDNYPLEGEYMEVTNELFRQLLVCLTAFLEQKIYIGSTGDKAMLAIPISDKRYAVVARGRFMTTRKEEDAEKLDFNQLRPIV